MNNSRSVAYELIRRVSFSDAYANLLMPSLLAKSQLPLRDRALAQEIAFGAVRYRMTLDLIIEKASGRTLNEIDEKVLPALELGAYQLLLTRIPSHAALNETVQLVRDILGDKLVGFANAVLRHVSKKSWDDWVAELISGKADNAKLAIRYSHPEWIITALKLALRADGREQELEDLLAVDNQPAPVNLVQLPGKDPELLVGLQPHRVSPIGFQLNEVAGGLGDFLKSGAYRVQDAGSQMCAELVVTAKPLTEPEKWLDLCAGPGGKSVLLAALGGRLVELTCVEPVPARAELVSKALKHSGLSAKVVVADGRALNGQYDRILVDAPCTGLGALRRRPESRYRRTQSDLAQLTKLQAELIGNAWRLLKPGGVLVYSTCSPHPAETTAIVEGLLRRHPGEAELIDAWSNLQSVSPSLAPNLPRKTLQLWPQAHDTDAMFAAAIRKSLT